MTGNVTKHRLLIDRAAGRRNERHGLISWLNCLVAPMNRNDPGIAWAPTGDGRHRRFDTDTYSLYRFRPNANKTVGIGFQAQDVALE
jgi:hypothetical protein